MMQIITSILMLGSFIYGFVTVDFMPKVSGQPHEDGPVGATVLFVPQGGTGASTLTGLVTGNGTAAFTASNNISIGQATSTNLGVTGLTAANCDLKATTAGSVYCGTDSGGSPDWLTVPGEVAIRPSSTRGIIVSASSTIVGNFKVDGNASTTGYLVIGSNPAINLVAGDLWASRATTTNLGVSSLNAVSCDVKATTGGSLYCGADADTGAGTGSNWSWGANQTYIRPSTSVGVIINASSTVIGNFKVDGNASTTGYFVIGTAGPTVNMLAGDALIGGTQNTTTIINALQLGSTARNAKLGLTAERNYPASVSVGGLFNLNNTNSSGAGAIIYTNFGSGASGRLMNVKCENTAFDADCLHIDSLGTQDGLSITAGAAASNALSITSAGVESTLNVNYTGSTLNVGAASFSSDAIYSTVNISGVETGQGSLKITHTGSGTDANASGLSVDVAGAGTAAQGVFVNSTGSTTGKLLNIRNNSNEFLSLLAGGTLGISSTTAQYPLTVNGEAYFTTHATTVGAVIIGLSMGATVAGFDETGGDLYVKDQVFFAGNATSTNFDTNVLRIRGLTGSTQCLETDTNGNVIAVACSTIGLHDWQTINSEAAIRPSSTRGIIINASSTITGNFNVQGSATTSNGLIIGTTPNRPVGNNPISGGDLFVGGKATSSVSLTIGSSAGANSALFDFTGGDLFVQDQVYIGGVATTTATTTISNTLKIYKNDGTTTLEFL